MVGRVSDSGSIVISVHKQYADAILNGSKTVELRRRFPEIRLDTKVWVYATKPVGAVIGVAVLRGVERATPAVIWEKYADRAGIDAASYDKYFEGVDRAVALTLSDARAVRPITLDQLRDIRMNFHPPQIVAALTVDEDHLLRKIARIR